MRISCLSSVILLWSAVGLQAQGIYSYVNEQGVTVFSNLGASRGGPPVETVRPLGASIDLDSHPRAGVFAHLIRDVAHRYQEDEDLITAIISVESDFDPSAVSSKNCKGLMQLHPDTARRFGVEDVFDPAQNIEGGVRYLRKLKQDFGQLDLVLAAYNAGENAVLRYDGVPPYPETRNYIRKVMARYQPMDQAELEARQARIQRVILPDGQVVLTNLPRSTGGDSLSRAGMR